MMGGHKLDLYLRNAEKQKRRLAMEVAMVSHLEISVSPSKDGKYQRISSATCIPYTEEKIVVFMRFAKKNLLSFGAMYILNLYMEELGLGCTYMRTVMDTILLGRLLLRLRIALNM